MKKLPLFIASLTLGLGMLGVGVASYVSVTPEPVLAWSGTQTSTEGNYYESARGLKGQALTDELHDIIQNANTSYDWSRYEAADEYEGDSSSILAIYSRQPFKKTTHVSGSKGWNREHVYPQSKLGGASKSDNHLIFASDNKVNGVRSNHKLGLVSNHNSPVIDSEGRATECYSSGSVFEPCDAAKGEVARATLYAYVMYDLSITGNFTSLDLCLEWNEDYPVSNREIYRNNTVYKNQKNRNPFVDHPEFATMIFDSSYNGSGALNDTDGTGGDGSVVDPDYVPVTSVNVAQSTVELEIGETYLSEYTVLPENATDKTVKAASSNPNIVSAYADGSVLANAEGSAVITLTSVDGPSTTFTVNVVSSEQPDDSSSVPPDESSSVPPVDSSEDSTSTPIDSSTPSDSSSTENNDDKGCRGSVYGSIGAAAIALAGLGVLFLVRKKSLKR